MEDKGLSKEERSKTEERLNQLKSNQMSKKDKEDLSRQMKDIKDKLERLSRNKQDKEKDLRDKADKGEKSRQGPALQRRKWTGLIATPRNLERERPREPQGHGR